jgi:diguanylate cyclase (GGDEF)-like protein/PAS domain S-box-containing protein
LFLCGLAGAVLIWFIDPFIDAVLLGEGAFHARLTNPGAEDLYFRLIVSLLPPMFGFLGSFLLARARKTERALKKSQDNLSKIFIAAPDLVIVSRLENGLLLYVNPAFTGRCKFTSDDLVGRTVFDLGFWVRPDTRTELVDKLKQTREVSDFETEFRTKDGETFVGSVSASIIELDGDQCMVSVIRDVTERKRFEEEIARAYHVEETLREILYISLQPLALERILSRALDVVLGSPVFDLERKGAIFLAREGDEMLELAVHSGLPEPLRSSCAVLPFGKCLCGQAAANREITFSDGVDERHEITYDGIQPHGHYCVPLLSGDRLLGVLNCYVRAGYTKKPEDERFLGTVADTLALAIGDKRAERSLETSYENLAAIMNSMDSMVYIADMDTHEVLFVNEYGKGIIGDGTGEFCCKSRQADLAGLFECRSDDQLLSADGNPTGVQIRHCQNTVLNRWYECRGQAVRWFDGRTVRMEIATDVTERRRTEDKIKHMASHDLLTGLPNRILFMDRLEQALARCRRNESMAAVMFIDLDNFKPVNDAGGHTLGDRVLKDVGERLSSCMRETDTVARFGGDEFVALMTDIENTDAPSRIAEKINAALSEPVNLGSKEVILGASIGIALYPDHAHTSDVLISLADKAMYEVKKKTKKGYLYAAPPEVISA